MAADASQRKALRYQQTLVSLFFSSTFPSLFSLPRLSLFPTLSLLSLHLQISLPPSPSSSLSVVRSLSSSMSPLRCVWHCFTCLLLRHLAQPLHAASACPVAEAAYPVTGRGRGGGRVEKQTSRRWETLSAGQLPVLKSRCLQGALQHTLSLSLSLFLSFLSFSCLPFSFSPLPLPSLPLPPSPSLTALTPG